MERLLAMWSVVDVKRVAMDKYQKLVDWAARLQAQNLFSAPRSATPDIRTNSQYRPIPSTSTVPTPTESQRTTVSSPLMSSTGSDVSQLPHSMSTDLSIGTSADLVLSNTDVRYIRHKHSLLQLLDWAESAQTLTASAFQLISKIRLIDFYWNMVEHPMSVGNAGLVERVADANNLLKQLLRLAIDQPEEATTSDGYPGAWASIEDHVENMLDVPAATSASAVELRRLLDFFAATLHLLATLNVPAGRSTIVAYLMLRKFDVETRHHVERTLLARQHDVSAADLIHFVEVHCETLATAAEAAQSHLSIRPLLPAAGRPIESEEPLLPTALLWAADVNGQNQLVRAVLDSGSQSSFITEDCRNRLQLRRTPAAFLVNCLANTTVNTTGQTSLVLQSRVDPLFVIAVDAFVLHRVVPQLPVRRLDTSRYRRQLPTPLADPQFARPTPVDMLLGINVFARLLTNARGGNGHLMGVRRGTPTAMQTRLGWVMMGRSSVARN